MSARVSRIHAVRDGKRVDSASVDRPVKNSKFVFT